MRNARQWAKQLLSHYFDQAGVIHTGDNQREIEDIVDNIIDAAVEETLRRIKEKGLPDAGMERGMTLNVVG